MKNTSSKPNTSYGGTGAIGKALAILKLFDDQHADLTLSELVHLSGLNKTTVFRILNALETEGLITKTKLHYRLGPEAIALGGRAMRANPLRKVSHEVLEHLAQQSGETVTLEILRADTSGVLRTLVIDEVLGKHLVGITQYIGSRLPVHATSSGKLLLAYQLLTTVQAVLSSGLLAHTAKTITDPHTLQQALKSIRQQGYSVADGELEPGLITIAAPIFDHANTVQAALSLVMPSVRMSPPLLQTFITYVCDSASAISSALGHHEHASEIAVAEVATSAPIPIGR